MPPSNRFPILRLPLLPLELVIKDLTPLDIFILAIASNKIHEHLKKNRTELETFHVKRRYDHIDVNLVPFNLLGSLIQLRLRKTKLGEKKRKALFDLEIGGKQYKARFSKKDSSIMVFEEIHENPKHLPIPQEMISAIVELLSDIFSGQKVNFESLPKEVVLPNIQKHSGVQELYLSHFRYREDSREDCYLTSDELSNLLENLLVEKFKLDWGVVEGLKYRKSLRYPKMIFFRSHWLTIDCILNMDCVSLDAYHVLLTVQDLKRFIQHWLDGGLEKLRCIQLYRPFGEFSLPEVMENIEKKPLQYVEDQMNMWLQNGAWEIKRNDGRRAGVHASDYFVFQVL